MAQEDEEVVTGFGELGICEQLVAACKSRGWMKPTKIQVEAIPHALQGKDLIGLAQTGSGKTGAFVLPILQALLESPEPSKHNFFACVISPTRELALQIKQEFDSLGVGVKCDALIGGVDMTQQANGLGKKPHIVVGTPGRLLDHLSYTKGFSLRELKYLESYLVYVLSAKKECTSMVFTRTREATRFLALVLRNLGLRAIPISGQMSQSKRLGALNKFKARECNILICTDVASRGLDIPSVDTVINYHVPLNSKDYIHRVGRTARAGRSGVAISLVNQYEVMLFKEIENLIGKKLDALCPPPKEEALLLRKRVEEAKRISRTTIRDSDVGRKKRRRHGDDDDGKEEIQRYFGKKNWKGSRNYRK